MFGIGMPEFLLIMAIALIVIGPKKLPDLAKALGKALGEFKKATSELKDSLDIDKPLSDVKRSFDNLNKDMNKNRIQGASENKDFSNESFPAVSVSEKQPEEKTEEEIRLSEMKIQEPEIATEKETGQKTSESKNEKTKNRRKISS